MPKYNIETTVIYRFQVEADSEDLACDLGDGFENYQWELEVLDVSATEEN
jgi:hypothetical protein